MYILTEIIPDVQIPSEQTLRLESTQKRILHALDQPLFAAQQIRQRTGVPLAARPIMPLNDRVHTIAQLMLNVRRPDFRAIDARTAGARWRPACLDQLLGIDGARNELADEKPLGGAVVDAAAQPSTAGESCFKNNLWLNDTLF